jgi:hypothetical protein
MGPSWIRLIVAGRLGFIQCKQTRLLGDEANASYLLLYKPAPPTGFGPLLIHGTARLSLRRTLTPSPLPKYAPSPSCSPSRTTPRTRASTGSLQIEAIASRRDPPVLYKLKPPQVAEKQVRASKSPVPAATSKTRTSIIQQHLQVQALNHVVHAGCHVSR